MVDKSRPAPLWRRDLSIAKGLSTLALTLVLVTTLLSNVAGFTALQPVAWAGLFVYFCLEFRQCTPVARGFLLLIPLSVVAVAIWSEHAWQDISGGLSRAAFMVTFVATLSYLRGAANGSHILRRSGRHLLTRAKSQRYLALSLGSHVCGVIISFGSISLLGSMVMQSGKNTAQTAEIRKQGILALFRGFAATTFWNPLSVSLAIATSLYPQVILADALPWGIATAILFLIASALFNLFSQKETPLPDSIGQKPDLTTRSAENNSQNGGWSVHLPLLGLILAIFGAIAVTRAILDSRIILAVMVTVPLVSLCWRLFQTARPKRQLQAWKRGLVLLPGWAASQALRNFPQQRNESGILSCAAFIGYVALTHLDPDLFVSLVQNTGIPTWLLPPAVIVFIILGVQIGGSPVLPATLAGAALSRPEVLGLSPLVMLISLACGWALSVQIAPLNVVPLITARTARTTSREVTYGWNMRHTIMMTIVICCWIAGLSAWL